MSKYLAGEVIKALRKQRGLSQNELADGILDIGQLSRIERGGAMPSKFTLEKLFERLGYDPSAYSAILLSKEEMKHQAKKDEIDHLAKLRRDDEAIDLLELLESDKKFSASKPNKQYLLHTKAKIARRKNEPPQSLMKMLLEAIKITMPKYKEEDINEYWLSRQETAIIESIAATYALMNQRDKAIELQYRIKDNFENRYMDVESRQSRYMPIIYNLTVDLGLSGRHSEALELCNDGIEACKRFSAYRFLPLISFNKACSLLELGDLEACKALLVETYFSFKLQERFDNVEKMEGYVKEKFGITLQELVVQEMLKKS